MRDRREVLSLHCQVKADALSIKTAVVPMTEGRGLIRHPRSCPCKLLRLGMATPREG
jgi:hypothetical protein